MPRHALRSVAALAPLRRLGRFGQRKLREAQGVEHPGAAALAAARQGALAALCALPYARLTAPQRRTLGAQLHKAGPALVDQVVRGIASQPARFAPLLGRGARLGALQAEADGWLLLRGALALLHERASDSYLCAQAEALDEARALLGAVEADAAAAPGDRDARARLAALRPAFDLLRHVRGRRPSGAAAEPGALWSPLQVFREVLRSPDPGEPAAR